jgi:hypothetical protein
MSHEPRILVKSGIRHTKELERNAWIILNHQITDGSERLQTDTY